MLCFGTSRRKLPAISGAIASLLASAQLAPRSAERAARVTQPSTVPAMHAVSAAVRTALSAAPATALPARFDTHSTLPKPAAAVAAPTAGPTPVHAYARATSRQRGAEAAAAAKYEPSSARAHALPPTHRSSRVLSCAVPLGLHILVLRRRRRVEPPRHSVFAHTICLRSSVCVPLSTRSVMTGWNRPTVRRRAPPSWTSRISPDLHNGDNQRRFSLMHRSDQVIRENPASRGTETSAEVLVGPPWRMESNAGQQQAVVLG
jgi:hypothetical protein